MTITKRSVFTGVVHTVDMSVTEAQLKLYAMGALVQEAFPHLDAGQREFLMTGVTPEEWENVFGKEG